MMFINAMCFLDFLLLRRFTGFLLKKLITVSGFLRLTEMTIYFYTTNGVSKKPTLRWALF